MDVSTAPSHGALSSFAGVTASSGGTDITPVGTMTYIPEKGYSGPDSFAVNVSDGTASTTRTISVTVNSTTGVQIEHFSDEATGTTSFTNSGFSFNCTGGYLKVTNYSNRGWTGSAKDDYYLDNYGNYPANAGVIGSIYTASGTLRAHSLYVFPGETGDLVKNTGSVIIRGKLGGLAKFTKTVASGDINTSGATNNGFTLVDLSAYNTIAIDTLEFELTGALRYLAIDAFKHESTAVNTNAAPTIGNLNGDSLSFTECEVLLDSNALPLDNGANATVSDADSANFDGGNLTVSIFANRVSTEDVLSIANIGTGAGLISVDGANVKCESITIGTVAGGKDANDLVVTLNSAATAAEVTALVKALRYSNTNFFNPSTATRTVRVTVSDGDGGTSSNALVSVSVVGVNDVPIVTTTSGTTAFTEGANTTSTPVTVDSGLTVTDDNSTLSSATVSITGNFQVAQDVLSFSNDGSTMGNIAASYNSGTGVLTMLSSGATATVAQWQSALRAVKYTNTSDSPATSTRTISFTVNDGALSSTVGTKMVSVAATNDAPTFRDSGAGNFSAAQSSSENYINYLLHANDPDGGQTLTWAQNAAPSHGTLNISGATASSGSADITPGEEITYTPTAGYSGSDSFTVQVSDGTATATRTINVTVSDPTMVISPSTLNSMTVGIQFSQSFVASGGTAQYSYSVTAGSLPDGLTLDSMLGILSGTPTTAEPYSFTIKATDFSTGNGPFTVTKGYTGTVVLQTAAPTVTTNAASNISSSGAKLNGTVNANNASTTVTFEYGLTTGYGSTATADQSPVTGTSATSVSAALTGLIPNTTYHYRVKSVNAGGTSNGLDGEFTTLAAKPDAPTSVTAIAGNAQASVSFTAPVFTGGATITGYTVTSSPGGLTGTGSASPIVVTGLTNGVAYTFTVTATNKEGTGSASSASSSVTPATVPDAPTSVTATAGNAQASVSFTAPASNGGAAITGYTVTSSPGGLTGTGSASPIVVTGLTNGTAYTFTVTATNSVGTSSASSASSSVTPATVPDAPTSVTAIAGNAQASVSFTAPASNGGAAITGYTVTSSPGGLTGTGSVSPIVVTGLTNGTAYTFTVTATNSVGTSSASSASSSVTPATFPGVPTSVTAIAGNAQASVSFTAPASNGGAAITGYTVTSSPGGLTGTGSVSPIVVTGLTNGTAYTFTVTATNSVGTGSASSASSSVTPATVPDAPTSVTATAGNAQASVSFAAPASNGGAAITGYTVTSNPAGGTDTNAGETGLTHVITGLTNGTAYTFTVTATNKVGISPSSTPASVPITPFTNSSISPTTANFDKYAGATNYKDISVTVTLNGNTLNGIKNGAYTLVEGSGKDYTIWGDTCTIKKEYLKTLSTGTVTLTFDFSLGVDPELAVDVKDTTPASVDLISAGITINGQVQDVGILNTIKTNGQTITTIVVDPAKFERLLEISGDRPTVVVQSSNSDVTACELNGQTLRNMENREAILEMRTGTVTYTLPAAQIDIDAVLAQFGSQVQLRDINVRVRIAAPSADTFRIVQDTANRNGYQIVVKPVDFEIICTSGTQTAVVSRFNGYVERTVVVPDGIDPSRITTGIVLNVDGTFSHVPTTIFNVGGRNYARINSLTNSTYSVIYNPVTFSDTANHWAKDAINNMGSRMIVTGVGNSTYEPERSITRAEFAAIVVRAAGLQKGTTESAFGDVTLTDWFNGYVETATAYSLITGYDSASYGPNDTITREQAMAIIARAMKLSGISVSLTDSEVTTLLSKYTDGASVSDYAKQSAALCLKNGIVNGTSASTISPKDYVTRAEVAVMVQRLLQKSGLI